MYSSVDNKVTPQVMLQAFHVLTNLHSFTRLGEVGHRGHVCFQFS